MKALNKIFVLICLICAIGGNFNAQNRVVDSLLNILKTAKQDTNRVNTLCELFSTMVAVYPDTALILGNQALLLSQKLNWKKGEAKAEFIIGTGNYYSQNIEQAIVHWKNALKHGEILLSSKNMLDVRSAKRIMGKSFGNLCTVYKDRSEFSTALEYGLKGLKLSEEIGNIKQVGLTLSAIGNIYRDQGDYPKALDYNLKSLKVAQEAQDKRTAGSTFVNIGNIYKDQANYPKAIEYYLNGLKLCEETGNRVMVGVAFGNIATVYDDQADYPKSLEYYSKGLKIAEEMNDAEMTGKTLANIAIVYSKQGNNTKALEFFFLGLKKSEEAGDKQMIGVTSGNIATFYDDQKNFKSALEYSFKALKIAEELDQKQWICISLGNIGNTYIKIGKYKDAEVFLKKAIIISKEIKAELYEKYQNQFLSILYEKTNRPALALEHYKKYIALRDTIFSQENSKKLMRTEMNHEYEKKKAVADAEHKVQIENQKLVAAEKTKKQNIIIASVIVGLVLVMIFAGFVFRSLRITSKQKLIIEQKNKETEEQKHEIEEKQKEILDSIRYAKRIQMAQIPSEKRVSVMLSKVKK